MFTRAVDTLVMRLPRNKEERMFAALNSNDSDIFSATSGRVYVTGKNKEGEVIELGHICPEAFFSCRKTAALLIERIRFPLT